MLASLWSVEGAAGTSWSFPTLCTCQYQGLLDAAVNHCKVWILYKVTFDAGEPCSTHFAFSGSVIKDLLSLPLSVSLLTQGGLMCYIPDHALGRKKSTGACFYSIFTLFLLCFINY